MIPMLQRHIDGSLQSLGNGSLSPKGYRRLVHHAKACHRCAALYDRSIRVLRLLEHQSINEPAGIELRSLEALGHQAPTRQRKSGLWLGAALAMVAAVGVFVVQTQDQWQIRGGGAEPKATLRLFCGTKGKPLHEVDASGCGVGESLAFAAGYAGADASIELQISGAATAHAVLVVTGRPGAEDALDFTVPLVASGAVTVDATIKGIHLQRSCVVHP